jgi:hypothetical protein
MPKLKTLLPLLIMSLGLQNCNTSDPVHPYIRVIDGVHKTLKQHRNAPEEASRQVQVYWQENQKRIKDLKQRLMKLSPEDSLAAFESVRRAFMRVETLLQSYPELLEHESIRHIAWELAP